MNSGVWIKPFDGWGFSEAVDGKLALPFEVEIDEVGVDFGVTKGWRGHVISDGHKYSGLTFEMTPRHTTWTKTVVIKVDGASGYAFSGMADARGLECKWL